jgi:N-carbamoyl-L-amino-acid hydrolase
MDERADPMLTAAMTVLAANKHARLAGAMATVGRMETAPGHQDTVAGSVTLWLDVAAADDEAVDALVTSVSRQAGDRAERDGTSVRFQLVGRGRR